jgi:riboflavin kinase/FMN adenylyltransferase
MKVLPSIAALSEVPGPVVVAIGVFDGVHLGHQSLICQAMEKAAAVNGTAVPLTFNPHPMRLLRPQAAPRLLTSTAHKVRLIESLGCSHLVLQPFDHEFAAQPPEAFIEALVAAGKPLHMVCVGHNWGFGKGRAGNVPMLRKLGEKLGFETLEIEPVLVDGELVSSTRIRGAIEEGDFDEARRALGRDYTILGTVVQGAGLGRKIGFPTMNLATHNEQFPPDGVYAVEALVRGESLRAVANIGVRPTVEKQGERLLEVHLIDYSGDCYGEDVEIRFAGYLRGEKKFNGLSELQEQIGRDVAEAGRRLVRPLPE